MLADKIEQFILHKLLEEDEENIVLRRNELADELDARTFSDQRMS